MATSASRMDGKICLVTGANSGIGQAIAAGLADRQATVVMLCRNRAKGEAAADKIRKDSGNDAVELLVADLAAFSSVRDAVHEFESRHERLNVLVNNAGVLLSDRKLTEDGMEMTIAVNHLGPFLLTNLLLDRLGAGAPGRIVNLTSSAQAGARLNLDDLQSERNYRPFTAYGQSKLANVLFTYELARRLERLGVTANCVHPGVVKTSFGREGDTGGFASFFVKALRPVMITADQGADTPLYLATSPEVEGVTGKYFIKRRPRRSSSTSYDEEVARRLWEDSVKLTGLDSAD